MDIVGFIQDGLKTISDSDVLKVTIVGMFTLALTGTVTWALRDLPKSIFNRLKRELTTTLSFNSQSITWGNYNQLQYISFLTWLGDSKWFSLFSRNITIESVSYWDGGKTHKREGIGPGVGTHLFRFNGRFFFAHISEKESQGTDVSKFNLTITCFGRSHKPLNDLLDSFKTKIDTENKILMYKNADKEWERIGELIKRPIESIAIEKGIIEEIVKRIREFEEQKRLVYENGNQL